MINDIAASDAAGLDDYLKALWRRKHFVAHQTDYSTKQVASLNDQANNLNKQIAPLTIEIQDLTNQRNTIVRNKDYGTSPVLQDQADNLANTLAGKQAELATLTAQHNLL